MIHRLLHSLLAALALATFLSAPVVSRAAVTRQHEAAHKVFHVKIVSDSKTVGRYTPMIITVHVRDRIIFSNKSDAAHTVTADKSKAFDSGNIAIGKSWTYVAKKVGTFSYHCVYHPLMHGKFVVKR